MKLPVWLHHFDHYRSMAAGPDDSALPISEIWPKALDAGRWMARFDPGLLRPADPGANADGRIRVEFATSLTRQREHIYEPQGITPYRPWLVVAGRDENGSTARDEGIMAGAAATASGAAGRAIAIVDLEPANHGPYWRNDLGAGPADVVDFVAGFVSATSAPRELWVAPDARDPWLAPVAFRTWAEMPTVTWMLPQVYWRMFQMSPEAALDRAFETLHRHGWRGRIAPILDATGSPEEMVRAIEHSKLLGAGGVSVFQRRNLTTETADAIAALPDPWETPARSPVTQQRIDDIHTATDRLDEHLRGLGV